MKNSIKLSFKMMTLIGVCAMMSGCTSLRAKTLKSPCGPLASLAGPCSDRTPINNPEDLETIFANEFVKKEDV